LNSSHETKDGNQEAASKPATAHEAGWQWLGKLLLLFGFLLVAIAGFGSSTGWFEGLFSPAENEVRRSSASELASEANPADTMAAASTMPDNNQQGNAQFGNAQFGNAQLTPPLDLKIPTESLQLLAEGKRVAEHLVKTMPGSVEAKEMQARFEFEFGETAKAEQLWNDIVQINPDYAYALQGLGDVAVINGHLEEAVSYFRRAVLVDPNTLSRQITLGIALTNASHFDEARRTFETVLARDSKRTDAHVELASVLIQLQDFEAAREHLEVALKTFPDLPEVHFGLATVYSRLGEKEKAKYHQAEHKRCYQGTITAREQGGRTYDDLNALNTDVGRLYTDMARTYLAGGFRDAAGLLLLRVSRMNAEDPESRRALAFLALSQGKQFDAIRWLTEILRLRPDDLSIAKEIARLQLQSGQPKAAEKVLFEYAEGHPQDVEARRELARFFVEVDRDEARAIQFGQAAAELAPTAESMALLASVYDAFQKLDKAIESLERAVELQPNNVSYQQGLALLRDALEKKNVLTENRLPEESNLPEENKVREENKP